MTPRAVLWDFGNVIVRWNPRTLYSKIFPDPVELDWFLANVCTLEWHAPTDAGLSFADNIAAKVAEHPAYEPQIRAWFGRWAEMFSGAIPETEAAIHALAERGVAQYGLSNISHETLSDTLAMSPAFDRLESYIASGHVGLLKPDPAIFRLACERFGLAPAEMLFIDDSARNVAAAAALGFHTLHFTDPGALVPTLRAKGLLQG